MPLNWVGQPACCNAPPMPTCMPWAAEPPPLLTTPDFSRTRDSFAPAFFFHLWFPIPGNTNKQIIASGVVPGSCGASRTTLMHYTIFPGPSASYPMAFQSYNPFTGVGTWRMPLSSPLWPGQDLYLQQ